MDVVLVLFGIDKMESNCNSDEARSQLQNSNSAKLLYLCWGVMKQCTMAQAMKISDLVVQMIRSGGANNKIWWCK